MKKFSLLILFLGCAPALSFAAKEAAPPSSHMEITQQSIRDRVKSLRRERMEDMPYLDRGYVRSSIRPEKVRDKIQFVSGKEKSLEDTIQRAIRVHTPAKVALERIALSRRRIVQALRNLFPETKFETQQQTGKLSDDRFNSFNYKFTFKQPIFRGGILWHTLIQQKADLEASEKEYDQVVQNVIRDVSKAYFDYNRSVQTVRDQQEAIERMGRYASISREKYEAQIISEIEYLNVESVYSQAQYDFETSKQELELAKLDLQRYLDLEIQDDLSITPFYQTKDLKAWAKSVEEKESKAGGKAAQEMQRFEGEVRIPSLAELVDLAYKNHPKLQVEAAKLDSARLEERIKWGGMLPHADATLEFGKLGEAFDLDELDPGLRKEFRFFLELKWNAAGNKVGYSFDNRERAPSITQFLQGTGSQISGNKLEVGLFDGLKELSETKEAEVERLKQVVELEKAEKEVIHDVKQAYYDYEKAKIQVRSSLQRVDYRERVVRLSEHRVQTGEIQIGEYLDTEANLLKELGNLHKALAEYFTAKSKLNHAVGIRDYLAIKEWDGSKSGK